MKICLEFDQIAVLRCNEMFLSDWEHHTDSMIPNVLAFAVSMLLIAVELTNTSSPMIVIVGLVTMEAYRDQ